MHVYTFFFNPDRSATSASALRRPRVPRPRAPTSILVIVFNHDRKGAVAPHNLGPEPVALLQVHVARRSSVRRRVGRHLVVWILEDEFLVAHLPLDVDVDSRSSRGCGVEHLVAVAVADSADSLTSVLC